MIRKRIIAALVTAALFTACAGNGAASGIREMIRFIGSSEPVAYELSAAFEKLPQFDENRTAQLNRLLKHFLFSGTLDQRETVLSVSMDGEKLFSVTETEVGGKSTGTLAPGGDPAVIIPEYETATDNLQYAESFKNVSENLDIYKGLEEYASFFENLPGLYPELSGSGKILEKYKDYGTAVKKVSIRFTDEEWTACVRKYAPETTEGSRIPDLRHRT